MDVFTAVLQKYSDGRAGLFEIFDVGQGDSIF